MKCAFVLLLSLALLGSAFAKKEKTVSVTDGDVTYVGVSDGNIDAFTGIRFGVAPVGNLRWKPPVKYFPESGSTINATEYPPECMQFAESSSSSPDMSEDCLFLNVWRPSPGSSSSSSSNTKLPVMVFIYGGSFVDGSSTLSFYIGDNLAANEDVIVVTLNYRLGPFGFLGHKGLFDEAGTTGNYGLLDQTMAIQWVVDNIDAFGGNPKQVTIFGESAGAISVLAQLASPLAKNLFQGAIAESGDSYAAYPLSLVEAQGAEFAEAAGCTGSSLARSSSSSSSSTSSSEYDAVLACMRALSAEEVLTTLPLGGVGQIGGATYGPTIDGLFLKTTMQAEFESQDLPAVPLIMGANHFGCTLFVFPNTTLETMDNATLQAMIYGTFAPYGGSELADAVSALYPVSDFDSYKFPEAECYSAILSDFLFTCPARDVVRAFANASVNSFLYNFTYVPDCNVFEGLPFARYLGSYHFAEIPYVFDNHPFQCEFSKNGTQISQFMQNYWGNFAYTQDPNNGNNDVFEWTPVTPTGEDNLVIDTPLEMQTTYNDVRCDFWTEILDNLTPKQLVMRNNLLKTVTGKGSTTPINFSA